MDVGLFCAFLKKKKKKKIDEDEKRPKDGISFLPI